MLSVPHHEFLQDSIRVQFASYILLCRCLLDRLEELSEVLPDDDTDDLILEDFLDDFNEALSKGFEDYDESWGIVSTVEHICALIAANRLSYKTKNPAAWEIIEQILQAATETSQRRDPEWNYQQDIDELHNVAHELARRFFTSINGSGVCQLDLQQKAGIVYLYDDSGREVDGLGERPFGYGASPVAYRQTYRSKIWDAELEKVILVRFVSGMNFYLYLAYPFMFLHEYTAHIFANDYKHIIFNDGWMLQAAYKFLVIEQRDCDREKRAFDLSSAQTSVFGEYLRGRLNKRPQRGCRLAKFMHGLLSGKAEPINFNSITYDLCAFSAQSTDHSKWPNLFLTKLYRYSNTAGRRQYLYEKLSSSTDLDELYSHLEGFLVK
jgi:hypothetical protein